MKRSYTSHIFGPKAHPPLAESLRSQDGFSLIELLVVMGVLGVLIGGAVFTINPLEQLQKARDTQRKNDLSQVARALEAFYQDYGSYPENTSNYKIDSDASAGTTEVDWGGSFAPYITALPKDPNTNRIYVYAQDLSGQSYRLYVSLERGSKDTDVCKADGTACDNAPASVNCGSSASEICNFGISSSNVSP